VWSTAPPPHCGRLPTPDAKPQLLVLSTPFAYQARAPKAITAMAHRLARLVYRMLKYGQTYVDKGTDYYEERFRQQQIQLLRKRAAKTWTPGRGDSRLKEFLERECQEHSSTSTGSAVMVRGIQSLVRYLGFCLLHLSSCMFISSDNAIGF